MINFIFLVQAVSYNDGQHIELLENNSICMYLKFKLLHKFVIIHFDLYL
jgi:hypothetical protein